MAVSISAFSYIGFIVNKDLSPDSDCDVGDIGRIPDSLRSVLDKYWNDGEFIGSDCPSNRVEPDIKSYDPIEYSVVNDSVPNQRTEKIVLRADASSFTWKRKLTSPTNLARPPADTDIPENRLLNTQIAGSGNRPTLDIDLSTFNTPRTQVDPVDSFRETTESISRERLGTGNRPTLDIDLED